MPKREKPLEDEGGRGGGREIKWVWPVSRRVGDERKFLNARPFWDILTRAMTNFSLYKSFNKEWKIQVEKSVWFNFNSLLEREAVNCSLTTIFLATSATQIFFERLLKGTTSKSDKLGGCRVLHLDGWNRFDHLSCQFFLSIHISRSSSNKIQIKLAYF